MSILAPGKQFANALGSGVLRLERISTLDPFTFIEKSIDVPQPSVIDQLIVSVSHETATGVGIWLYNSSSSGGGNYIVGLHRNGTEVHNFRPSRINANSSPFWDVLEYNTAESRFVFSMRRPLICPQGFSISRSNEDSHSHSVGVLAFARVY